MIKLKRRFNDSPGQALVEFALILTVLLMMIFLIIESARILWAWNTVQNAAREGARYAITGQAERPTCAVDFGLPKFVSGGRNVCDDLRVASIIDKAHEHLAGLPLDEESVTFEEDQYYNIEMWGVDQSGQLQYDFAGIPSNPVIVRVTYRVPIITPFFRPILPSIPVFGQETLNNETFGNLGGSGNDAAALPPNLPPVPTPGVTPSPTPVPPTDTPGPTATPSDTPTATPTPRCDILFEGAAITGNNFVFVTGDVGIDVTVSNLTTGQVLGTATLAGPFGDDHACPGFASVTLDPGLTSNEFGDILIVRQDDVPDNADTTVVVGAPPTPTPSPTFTPVPTNTPTSTPVQTNTPTPSSPYITILPSCGPGPTVQFDVLGFNWPVNQSINVFWNGTTIIYNVGANQHNGTFSFIYTRNNVAAGTYPIVAVSGTNGASNTVNFTVPCIGQPTNTPTPIPSATTAPADLIAVAPPILVSTPPIVGYQPVQFSVAITNTGTEDVSEQFFVDIYLDPTTILTDRIPLAQSDGYSAVSGLPGGASRVITITSPLGFNNTPTNHQIYGMVDSVLQIDEADETNNITQPLAMNNVTPGPTPTSTTVGSGIDQISGFAIIVTDKFIPQYRATIKLMSGGSIIAVTSTDINGYYVFNNVSTGVYSVSACISIDNEDWFGVINGIVPPNNLAYIGMFKGPCS